MLTRQWAPISVDCYSGLVRAQTSAALVARQGAPLGSLCSLRSSGLARLGSDSAQVGSIRPARPRSAPLGSAGAQRFLRGASMPSHSLRPPRRSGGAWSGAPVGVAGQAASHPGLGLSASWTILSQCWRPESVGLGSGAPADTSGRLALATSGAWWPHLPGPATQTHPGLMGRQPVSAPVSRSLSLPL